MSATQIESTPVVNMSLKELQALVLTLQTRIEALEAPKPVADTTEMTDDHARQILTGDLKNVKHKEAAAKLGLTYGQIYSCRKEFTFKHIHKAMKDAKIKNEWA
jgi:hypothetical protein